MRIDKLLPERIKEVTGEEYLKRVADLRMHYLRSGGILSEALSFEVAWMGIGLAGRVLECLAERNQEDIEAMLRDHSKLSTKQRPIPVRFKTPLMQLPLCQELGPQVMGELTKVVEDETSKSLVAAQILHRAKKGQNFLLQKDFFDDFRGLSLSNLQFRHLPLNMCGFVKLPYPILDCDGDPFDHFWFYTGTNRELFLKSAYYILGRDPDTPIMALGYVHKKGARTLTMHFPEDLSRAVNDVATSLPADSASAYPDELRLLCNVLAYLNTGKPDIREFKNQIRYRSPTSTKAVRADQCLSQESIVLVGYNYLKDRQLREGAWQSRSHLGWRWCGPGRTELRLVLVSSSTKRWHSVNSVEPEFGED